MFNFEPARRFAKVKNYSQENLDFKQIGEIVQANAQPNSGKSIVNLKWARLYSAEKTTLEDSSFEYGCAVVSNYSLVFIFGRR